MYMCMCVFLSFFFYWFSHPVLPGSGESCYYLVPVICQIADYIGCFSHQGQKQVKGKSLFWFSGHPPEGSPGGKGMAWQQGQEAGCSHFHPLMVRLTPKGSLRSPNSTNSWAPKVLMHEPTVGDRTSHSNHYKDLLACMSPSQKAGHTSRLPFV